MNTATLPAERFRAMPSVWRGLPWAMARARGLGQSRLTLTLTMAAAVLRHRPLMRRWMAVLHELHARGLLADLPAEYLRAVLPYVHMGVSTADRIRHLIDHADWLEAALVPGAVRRLVSGESLPLASLTPPRGFESMRLVLSRPARHSPEGDLLLTLALRREERVHVAPPIELCVVAFSCFRVEDRLCLVVGGIRGQRHPVLRLSPVEINNALQGWKPAVFQMRVMQELARLWDMPLLGLDADSHFLRGWPRRLRGRNLETWQRIDESYAELWDHFDAPLRSDGWRLLPRDSDEALAATALSPEKRARQIQRADFWMRSANQMRQEFKLLLQRPERRPALGRNTVSDTVAEGEAGPSSAVDSDSFLPPPQSSRVLETGPAVLN